MSNLFASQPWIAFAPELGLGLSILWLFTRTLFSKSGSADPKKTIFRFMIQGKLIFILIVLLWPFSGTYLNGAFRLDAFSIFLKGLFLWSGGAVIFMAREYLKKLGDRANEFILLILIALLGSFFLASSQDLITLFISVEWVTISLYILVTFLTKDRFALEAGTKYLVIGSFSAALFLYGISLVYGAAGSVSFEAVGAYVVGTGHQSPLLHVGALLILAGIGFKIAVFPFHFWAPDVYEGAPTPITAFLSVVSKGVGVVALIKILFLVVGSTGFYWSSLAAVLSAATMLYGNLGALGQTNIKRLLAYSSIGHAGYLLMGLACGTEFGTKATLFYLTAYAISNMTAFACVTIANRELRSGDSSEYKGLSKRSPVLAATLFVALLSLGGIPPLVGFFGKFLVLQAAVQSRLLWLALLGAGNVVIALYYYLSIIKEMYLKRPSPAKTIKLPRDVSATLVGLASAIVLLGFLQGPVLYLLNQAVATL